MYQINPKPLFQEGKNYVGPAIGLSLGNSGFVIGGSYENATTIQDIPGLIGFGAIFRYWSYSRSSSYWSRYYNYSYTYTNIVIGGQANYHFKFGDGRWDAYVGLVLAYNVGSVSRSDYDGDVYDRPSHGGLWFSARFGTRYFFNSKMALNVRFGAGSGSGLDVGLDFVL